MKIHELTAARGAKKAPKRIGRGTGSGIGKTSARGQKGQNSRSGGGVRPGFEGGQMPLSRRLPKRGFTNIFAKEFAVIDLDILNMFEDGAVVDVSAVVESGKAKKALCGLKVLGSGDIKKKLTVRAKKFTKTAKEKIEAAGGSAEVV